MLTNFKNLQREKKKRWIILLLQKAELFQSTYYISNTIYKKKKIAQLDGPSCDLAGSRAVWQDLPWWGPRTPNIAYIKIPLTI